MDVRYFEGNDIDYAIYIKSKGIGDKAILIAVDGRFEWKIMDENDTEYILRPKSHPDAK